MFVFGRVIIIAYIDPIGSIERAKRTSREREWRWRQVSDPEKEIGSANRQLCRKSRGPSQCWTVAVIVKVPINRVPRCNWFQLESNVDRATRSSRESPSDRTSQEDSCACRHKHSLTLVESPRVTRANKVAKCFVQQTGGHE